MTRPRHTPSSRSTGDYRHDAARHRQARKHRRIAVKVTDQRGNEGMWVVGV